MSTSPHGTPARYGYGRCRCAPCRKAAADASRRRYRLKAYGQWQPWADAAPVREHVRSLQAQGIGWQRTARLAGVSLSTVSTLLYGRGGKPPTARIRPATARALLDVRPTLDTLPGTACVDATGTRRRMQALVAAGHPQQRLADRLGKDRADVGRIVRGETLRVTVATVLAVRALYGELWDQSPPEGTPGEKTAASRARKSARRHGWMPVGAWDDDPSSLHFIDDPAAVPVPGCVRGERREWGAVTEDAAWLTSHREHPEMIASRLGVTPETVERTLQRAGQAPWRAAA